MEIYTVNLLRDILAYVAIFLLILYLLFKCHYNYWKDRNFPYLVPSFPLGNNKQFWSKFPGPNMDSIDHYKEIKKRGLKFAGVFSVIRPILVVADPDIVKDILVKDFEYFADRGFYKTKADPLSLTVFAMDAAEWKETRIRLTPTFTSGKIKMMIPLVQSVSEQMITEINKLAEKDADIDIKEVTTSFTINTLANCALGIETKSGNDIFTEMTKKHFYPTDCGGILRFTLMNRFPELCGKLGLPFVRKETADFFRKIFRDSMNYRDESGISRPDFLELLMKLKNQSRNTPKPLSDDYLTAQVFLFFIASLDTSSSAISFALYELANNPDMQERTREEIIQVLEKHNNQITSDCLKEMKYLNQVINETLRLYPSVTNLERRCVRNYKIAGTELIVERGVYITIPLYGIHRDPDFYQDPERFDPDRFNEKNKKDIKSQTYFPFGLGPRNCVGNRFGIMVTQVALIEVLRMFRISVSSSTILPFEMDKQTLILVLKNPILLKAEKINNECDNLMI